MQIDIYEKEEYLVLRLKEDVGLNTDLSDLRSAVEFQLSRGASNIAIAFTRQSYLYTKSIAVLIACLEIIKDAGGRLAILEPNRDILDIISVIDFDKMIALFDSEKDMEAGPQAGAPAGGLAEGS